MSNNYKTVKSSKEIETIVQRCLKEASKRGLKVTGIRRNNKCMTTKGSAKYDRYGGSNNCKTQGPVGVGKDLANFVYVLKKQP